MTNTERSYIPAMGRHAGLPFYDPLLSLIGGNRVRRIILDGAGLRPGQRILDVGCGTGTLLAELAKSGPSLELVGLDPDPQALARAARKLHPAGTVARLDQGFADALPYQDASFDHLFSSFMFHHLGAAQQEHALAEMYRVLKAGGTLHLLDFQATDVFAHGLLGLVHRHDRQRRGAGNQLVARMLRAGFSQAAEVTRSRVLVQPVVLQRAVK